MARDRSSYAEVLQNCKNPDIPRAKGSGSQRRIYFHQRVFSIKIVLLIQLQNVSLCVSSRPRGVGEDGPPGRTSDQNSRELLHDSHNWVFCGGRVNHCCLCPLPGLPYLGVPRTHKGARNLVTPPVFPASVTGSWPLRYPGYHSFCVTFVTIQTFD